MNIRILLSGFILSALFIACTQNALSGKRQFTLLPESELQWLANSQYRQFLTGKRILGSSSNADAAMVNRVGERIVAAVNRLYAEKGMTDRLKGYDWEVNLVQDNQINAWCMPGGKIVVYTGLLPVSQNEEALAAVMGHEVCHALLQHGNQRMSQALVQQLGGVALSVALSDKPQETRNIFMLAYGVGTQLGVMLPFSRSHELDADRWGLIMSAMAGYDPRAAIGLWERMERAGGGKTPSFLNTHPSEGKRIERLQQIMPEAMEYYNKNKR
jgi:predicted Zn-dependent protease